MGKRTYFTIIPTRALDDPELTDAALVTLMHMAPFVDEEGWCDPDALRKAAERKGCSRQTLLGHIKLLIERGYIERRRQTTDRGLDAVSRYRILYDYKVSATPTVVSASPDTSATRENEAFTQVSLVSASPETHLSLQEHKEENIPEWKTERTDVITDRARIRAITQAAREKLEGRVSEL